jgi:hAT family C-terminal dimerisation region
VFGDDHDMEFDEVSKFSAMKAAPKECGTLKWWITHQESFPRLFLLAMDFLVIRASSAPAECTYSKTLQMFNGHASLHNGTFKAEMCLCSWKQLMSSKSNRPPCRIVGCEVVFGKRPDAAGSATTTWPIQI